MFAYYITAKKIFHHDGYDDVVTAEGDVLRVSGLKLETQDVLKVEMYRGKVHKVKKVKQ